MYFTISCYEGQVKGRM